MFARMFSNPDIKSNTTILDQTFIPKISYTELQTEMTKLFDLKKLKNVKNSTEDTSLTQYWDLDKQANWKIYKNVAIKLILSYAKTHKLDILELYALLGDCRNIIAMNLQQKDVDKLGKTRPLVSADKLMHERYRTLIKYTDIYASFAPALVEKFRSNGWSDEHNILIDDIVVTELCLNDIGEYAITIMHCEPSDEAFGILAKKIKNEFSEFLNCDDKDDILQSIAKLVYYFVLAMPLERGSAATTEMMIQVLLKGKGLYLEYTDNIPLDLHAFLAKDINEFIEIFCSTHKTKKISQKHEIFFKPKSEEENEDIFSSVQSLFGELDKENCLIS